MSTLKEYLKEGKVQFTDANDMAKKIEDMISGIFPKSYVKTKFIKILGQLIVVEFALGKRNEWQSNIIHNDPAHHKILIGSGQFHDKDTMIPEKLTVDAGIGGSFFVQPTEKYLAFGHVKTGWRKKTGTPEQVYKHLENYFKKMKKTMQDNKDKFTDAHRPLIDKY